MLTGVRILVTRPREQASPFVDQLRARGAEAIVLPLIEIVPAAFTIEHDYDIVIFTSANAVADFKGLRDARVIAVGPATARALEIIGVTPDWIPTRHTSDAIASEIGEVRGKRILLPRSDIAREELPAALRERGAIVDEVIAYRNVPASTETVNDILAKGIDVVTFFSASAVRSFASAVDIDRLSGIVVACIGEITADAARVAGLPVEVIADDATAESLAAAIDRHMAATA